MKTPRYAHPHTHINTPRTASVNTWKTACSCGSSCHLLALRVPLQIHHRAPSALKNNFSQTLWWRQASVWCRSTLRDMWQAQDSHLRSWCQEIYNSDLSRTERGYVNETLAWKKSLTCQLKEPNWRVSVVWSGQYMENAENALFGFEGDKKKILRAAKVQLVWYTMWDPNICLQEAVFFLSFLSLRVEGPWLDSTMGPQQSGRGYTAQTSRPFDITLRNHEVRGRLFLPRHKGVIFHSPRENSGE